MRPGPPAFVEAPAACMNCACRKALMIDTPLVRDFDVEELPASLRPAFVRRRDGLCMNCGLYQAYERPSLAQLREMNRLGKDITTTEPALQQDPVPAGFVDEFNRRYFSRRLERWGEYFDGRGGRPARCLFVRSWFGASARFMRERYGSEVAGVDMSPACLRTAERLGSGFHALGGAINGILEGDFVASGPYDAVFVMHVMTHSVDVHASLATLKSLLGPGGCIVFTHETVRKPTNPFHMVHLSEHQLRGLLLAHFPAVDRIDDCEAEPAPHVTPYTARGDVPDLVARVD